MNILIKYHGLIIRGDELSRREGCDIIALRNKGDLVAFIYLQLQDLQFDDMDLEEQSLYFTLTDNK